MIPHRIKLKRQRCISSKALLPKKILYEEIKVVDFGFLVFYYSFRYAAVLFFSTCI